MNYRILALLLLPASAFADWGSFRGPGGGGIGSGDPPATWNVGTGENILWQTDIPGLAHSSPIVHGARVLVTTAVSSDAAPSLKVGMYGSGDSPAEDATWTWQVLCLDRATGKMLWQQTAHSGRPKQKRHTKATHANCTPATNGKVVVAMFGSEGLFCYDADGTLKWKADLGLLKVGPHNFPSMQWGFASSPVIHADRVIMQCDVLGGGFVAVLDLATGKEVRRIPRKDVATWSTPTIHVAGTQTQVICNGYKHIGAYGLATGEAIWWLRGGGDIPVPRPFVADGLVFISNAHGRMSPIYAIRPNARGDITPRQGETLPEGVAWWNPRAGSYIPTPIVYRGLLYVASDRGVLACFEARTGKPLFRQRIVETSRETYSASPVAAGGRLYLTSERGQIHVVEAGPKYRRLATNGVPGVCMATPAIDNGQLLIRTTKQLFSIAAGKE